MPDSFELRQIETLENFMSLKRGISNAEVAELEAELFPGGVHRKVSTADIDRIERTLNCRLSEDYKSFLQEYGYACWFGFAINGIPPIDRMSLDSYNWSVTEQTLEIRSKKSRKLKDALRESIVLAYDQLGGYYLMDPANETGLSQVRHVEHEEDFATTKTWPSFSAFVKHFYFATSEPS